jgi:hypothetical protein
VTSLTISVPVLDDSWAEGDEQFLVALSSPSGAAIADGEVVGAIAADVLSNQDFIISTDGRTVEWWDVDGDKVTLQTKGLILAAENLTFRAYETVGDEDRKS